MPEPPSERRRYTRFEIQTRAVLKGTDSASRDFFERTEVLSFDQRGARVRTRFLLNPGAEVELQLPTEQAPKKLRVVWQGEAGTLFAGMVGLELVDPNDSWDTATLRSQWEARET